MVKCFGCNQEWENATETPLVFADRHSDKVYGLCFACRRHIEIGRAVEVSNIQAALGRYQIAFAQIKHVLSGYRNDSDQPTHARRFAENALADIEPIILALEALKKARGS